MTKVCINRPNRSRKRVFRERDVGRIVAYARNDGAEDPRLIAYVLQGFGIESLACLLFRILDILNNAAFLGAILSLLTGLLAIVKGIKLVITRSPARVLGTLIEKIIPKRWAGKLGVLLAAMGALQAAISLMIIFLTAISNNAALFFIARGVCTADLQPLNVGVRPLDLGEFKRTIDDAINELSNLLEDAQNGGIT